MNRRSAKWQRRQVHPTRAVVDIGSNTVRLVIYEGNGRAPETVWNEKIAARLGRDLSATGRIPDDAMTEALDALARYATILTDRGIGDVQTVATAAAREAENGPEFLARIAEIGLEPRLLSGAEEARASALGAIGAFPGARGVVADLGGGSLELVAIRDGECHEADSLPFGTLRLPALRAAHADFPAFVAQALDGVGLDGAQGGALYMIGGTWRALAAYAMRDENYPLTDPHAYRLPAEKAARLARELVDTDPEDLSEISQISAMRAAYLPDAAALLLPLLEAMRPAELIFSSWGLREGLLYDRLDGLQQARDPLLAGINGFCEPRDAPIVDATRVAGWTVALARGHDGPAQEGSGGNERLRLGAAQLAAALQRVEPNLRAGHAVEWSLDKRWVGIDARGRAMVCAALFGSLGRTALPDRLDPLASAVDLREAVTWGLGLRLARRLGAGSGVALMHSRLRLGETELVLHIDESRAALATYPLTRDMELLAEWLEREQRIAIGAYDFAPESLAP